MENKDTPHVTEILEEPNNSEDGSNTKETLVERHTQVNTVKSRMSYNYLRLQNNDLSRHIRILIGILAILTLRVGADWHCLFKNHATEFSQHCRAGKSSRKVAIKMSLGLYLHISVALLKLFSWSICLYIAIMTLQAAFFVL